MAASQTRVASAPQSRWLSLGLIAGIVILAVIALGEIRRYREGARSQRIGGREQESPLAWQSRIWKDGFSAGEGYIQSGAKPLAREAINERSGAKYPIDLTADVLWSTCFESGQILAATKK